MEWITIVSLLAFGIILLVAEIVFIPGTTLVGLCGLILMGIGIWLGFRDLSTAHGYLLLGISVIIAIVAVYFSLRTDAWRRFALTQVNHSKVNEDARHELEVGETGKTISSLRPSGTGFFHGQRFEVQTNGEFISTGSDIKIVKIVHHKIIVEKVV
jgi:membrane-bound ClpP family serine protease